MEGLPVWAQGGIAGLTLAALVYVFLGMRSLFREFMEWAGNHMSKSTEAQMETAAAIATTAEVLRSLKEEVGELRRSVDRHTYN